MAGLMGSLQAAVGAVSAKLQQWMPGKAPSDPEIAANLQAMGFGYADEAIRLVDNEYSRRISEHQPIHLRMRLNQAFVDGDQNLDVNTYTGALEQRKPRYWWQSQLVFNQIAPIVEVRQSKLTRARPALKARPASNEQRDISSARVSAAILAANEHDQGWHAKFRDIIGWMEDGVGTAVTKDVWDSNKGRLVAVLEQQIPADELPPEENPSSTSQTEPVTTTREVREGNADTVVCNPYGILPDSPWRSHISEVQSIIEARAMPVQEIYTRYGVVVDPEPVDALTGQIVSSTSALGIGGSLTRLVPTQLQGHALVKEYWERPSVRYPQGRLIVVAHGKLLQIGPMPYKIGQDGAPDLPYTFWYSLKRPGSIWGVNIAERLEPVQRSYNALRNRRHDALNRSSIGQWNAEEGSVDLDDMEENGGAPGHIFVRQRGTQAPTPVQQPPLPVDFAVEEQILLNEFTTLSGVSDISRKSEAPAGVKSGVALSLALEQDDTRLAQTIDNIEQAAVEHGIKVLRLYKQFAQGVRISRYPGSNRAFDTLEWEASDITAEDLFVENSGALAESPAQRQQKVFDLLQAGLLFDPETGKMTREGRLKAFDMLQLGDWEDGTDLDSLQTQKQDREIVRLMKGQPVNVDQWDNHLLHLGRLVRYMLQAEYEEKLGGPQGQMVAQAFMAHYEAHMTALAQSMAPPPQAGLPAAGPALPGAPAPLALGPGAQAGAPMPPQGAQGPQ